MLIAVTAVNGVITKSRLSSFHTSSDMLEKAASTYVHATNTSVAQGATTTILYSDLKSSGFMERVVDPISKNECTNSRVYVTNTNGTYTYKGALVCDNYMDIDSYNLITNNDFSNGTTGWLMQYVSLSINSKIAQATCNGTGRYPGIYQQNISAINTQKFYVRSKARVTDSSSTAINFSIQQNTGASFISSLYPAIINNPIQNQWYTLSGISQLNVAGMDNIKLLIFSSYADNATANGKIMQLDGTYGVYALNLTSIYGNGNEPTVVQMDKIMSNMGK